MDKFVIHGGRILRGTVRVGGSKNAALPMMAASLLLERGQRLLLRSVPDLADTRTMAELLTQLGVHVERDGHRLSLSVRDDRPVIAPYQIVRTMRASICVLGPLLARRGKAQVSLPGGCAIGSRPVDLHLRGLARLKARLTIDHGYIRAHATRLKGATTYLGGSFGSTVTGTGNLLMAATLAHGDTIIEHAAQEPEIQELARLLNAMGARVEGIGGHRLVIHGVDRLYGAEWTVMPDRIEAGTFMAAAAITGGDVTVENVRAEHMIAVLETLRQMGARVEESTFTVRVRGRPGRRLEPVDITTLPYPGFPTDLQAPFMAALTQARDISVITERIYPDRFSHAAELGRMGARITKQESTAIIVGVRRLSGAPVMASDLRGGAGLVLAGLAAKGCTEVRRVYHIQRGYEHLERRLSALGASIRRVADTATPALAAQTA
ncbi:MAG: UDP-N-acetylglucosamine 1-carboxyvinyltransferase [Planctomycetes bacterium]|nr:UDP-N-acetylglucosamine 1-carboxyvinyltransferase [Planctomycetota bacterium]